MHILSKYRWRIQADVTNPAMVPSVMCYLDSGGVAREYYLHGARDGRGEGAKTAMEACELICRFSLRSMVVC